MSLPFHSVKAAFNALCQVAQARADELKKFEKQILVQSSDEENESINPLFQSFFESIEPTSVHKMTDFTPVEIDRLHNVLRPGTSTA